MARFMTWAHLSRDQLQCLKSIDSDKAATAPPAASQILLQLQTMVGYGKAQQTILLDLYAHTLRQGQAWAFTDEKLACLFSIVAEVHEQSVQQRLTIQRSFTLFKDTMLNHSVQRPPFSMGVFNHTEMHTILRWMLSTYYRHYKLYQYAFTDRVTMSVTSHHPGDLVETAPQLPPLQDAITEEEHQQQLDEEQRQRQAEDKAAAEAAAAAAEAERQKQLQEEYEESLPDDIKERVQAAVTKELERLKRAMEAQFNQQQEELLSKLAALEAKKAAAAP